MKGSAQQDSKEWILNNIIMQSSETLKRKEGKQQNYMDIKQYKLEENPSMIKVHYYYVDQRQRFLGIVR